MRLVRIVKRKFADLAWSGYGAQQYGGRWNSVGRRAVYCATSQALAMLEMLVHLNRSDLLHRYQVQEVDVPAALLLQLADDDLPPDWRDDPAPASTQHLGDEWLQDGNSLGLIVPSVIVPDERNVVLNPLHPDFAGVVSAARVADLSFDPRLKAG